MMKPECKTALNSKCSNTGLQNAAVAPLNSLPSSCDYVTSGVDKTSDSFITTCFEWIARNYLKRSVVVNPDQLVNDNALVTATGGSAPTTAIRLLQVSVRVLQDAPSVVANTADPSNSDSTFSGVTLSSSDVTVDGSTPTSTGSTDAGLTEINQTASAGFAKFSLIASLIVILAFIF
jgi:hypothetical protein